MPRVFGVRRTGWVIGFVFVALLPFSVRAESISNFSVSLEVDAKGVVEVVETIEVDFGSDDRHGIFRTIPVSYERDGFRYRLRLAVRAVQRDGVDEAYTTSRRGDELELKIGQADQTISGRHRYRIQYTVLRALNWFDDRPELYWNATGNAWAVPIERSLVTVVAPALPSAAEDSRCYTGVAGSTEQQCSIATIETLGAAGESRIAFSRGVPLAPGEALTAVVRLPADSISRPGLEQDLMDFFADNLGFGLPVAVLAIMLFLYRRFGKDPLGRGTIIAHYEPPEKLSPAMVGFLIDERVDPRDLTASILNLAVKGYLTIEYVEKTLGHTYRLTKRRAAGPELTQFEQQLFHDLFLTGSPILLSDLKRSMGKAVSVLRTKLQADAQEQKYFVHKPHTVRTATLVSGAALLFAGIQLIGLTAVGIGLILSGAMVMAFAPAMAKRTAQGVRVTEQIKGFKRFLSVTDAERFRFHNAPARRPQQFMTFLPYAVALGVEKEWAKQFQDVTLERPDWYRGNFSTFNAMVFATSLRDFSSTAQAQAVAVGSAAGAGSSGFSGGFSGGGFGGGGGGSW